MKVRSLFCICLLLSIISPAAAVDSSALGSAREILERTDPAHREKIERLLPRMNAEEAASLAEALREYDKYSTYRRTISTASGFLAVVGLPVGVLAWVNTIRIIKPFFNLATISGALKLWAAGAAGGAAFVFGGLYLLHRMHLRPEAVAKLHGRLDSLIESTAGRTTAAATTGTGTDSGRTPTHLALQDRPGLQLLGNSMAMGTP